MYKAYLANRSGHNKINVVHLVDDERIEGSFEHALCGKLPSGKSFGWTESLSNEVTCSKCKKLSGE